MRAGWDSGQGSGLLGSRKELLLVFLKTAPKTTCWLTARDGLHVFFDIFCFHGTFLFYILCIKIYFN